MYHQPTGAAAGGGVDQQVNQEQENNSEQQQHQQQQTDIRASESATRLTNPTPVVEDDRAEAGQHQIERQTSPDSTTSYARQQQVCSPTYWNIFGNNQG